VSKVQALVQERDPEEKPKDEQLDPPRLLPSQDSPVPITSSPQPGTVALISTVIECVTEGISIKMSNNIGRVNIK
jgi:hypothetical protein